jgi:hypothetical protein
MTRPGPATSRSYRYPGLAGCKTGEYSGGLTVTHPLPFALDLSACLGGGLPVLMSGEMNAKHVEWNSRLIRK